MHLSPPCTSINLVSSLDAAPQHVGSKYYRAGHREGYLLSCGRFEVSTGQLCHLLIEGCHGSSLQVAKLEEQLSRLMQSAPTDVSITPKGAAPLSSPAPVHSSPSLAKSGRRRSAFELVRMALSLSLSLSLLDAGQPSVLRHKALLHSVRNVSAKDVALYSLLILEGVPVASALPAPDTFMSCPLHGCLRAGP